MSDNLPGTRDAVPRDPALVARAEIEHLRLSMLLDASVVTEDGRKLGHVHEVSAERTGRDLGPVAGQAWTVSCLLIGRRSIWARYGLHPRNPHKVAWGDVVGMRGRTIVVRYHD